MRKKTTGSGERTCSFFVDVLHIGVDTRRLIMCDNLAVYDDQ